MGDTKAYELQPVIEERSVVNDHTYHSATEFAVSVKEGQDKLSTLYCPVSILRKSTSGRHRPVRVADGPMTARCRFT